MQIRDTRARFMPPLCRFQQEMASILSAKSRFVAHLLFRDAWDNFTRIIVEFTYLYVDLILREIENQYGDYVEI